MLKLFHILLAYLTVLGFVVRGVWALSGSSLRDQKLVRILPHVVDTLLLVFGVLLMLNLGLSPLSGWLSAKLLGLLVYIGFGVMTMRASSPSARLVGFIGALLSAGYIFAVAFTRSALPFLAT